MPVRRGNTTVEESAEVVTDQYGLSTGQVIYRVSQDAYPTSPALGAAHPYVNYMLMEQRRARRMDGYWLVTGDYAGCDPVNLPNAVFEMDFTDNEEPIEIHKNFVNESGFGWDTTQPPESAPQNGALFDAEGKFVGFVDPAYPDFFGVTSFFDGGAIYKITYVLPKFQVNFNAMFLSIARITAPPSFRGLPSVPNLTSGPNEHRNWLERAPCVQQRGGAVIITRQFLLSGRAGWNPIVYPN